MALWPGKPLLTAASLAALLAAPYFFAPLARWRMLDLQAHTRLLEFTPRALPVDPAADDPAPGAALSPTAQGVTIEDPHSALDSFYATLLRTERNEPGAVTRILHYGDSPTTADLITADLRHLLQTRFGDAGHGFHLLAKPWAWYKHRGVEVTSAGWQVGPVTLHAAKDGWYGLGGVNFSGGPGAWTRFKLQSTRATRLVLHYAGWPGAGAVSILAAGQPLGAVETELPEPGAARQAIPLPPGHMPVEIRVERGSVRLFGVSFESDGPGLLYDSLGLNGVSAVALVQSMNEAHLASQLRAARPSLVVINYGTNESGFEKYINTTYRSDLRKAIQRVRRAVPDAAVLIMSPMDRGVRESTGLIGTIPSLPKLVSIQREVAAEQGCAFFNTFDAMGGKGTMGKWYAAEPRLVSADFIHPLPAGGRVVANLMERALMRGYNLYKLKLLRTVQTAEVRP